MQRRALITGITGMDGSHLADLLLKKGYKVCGMIRRSTKLNMDNIKHIERDIELIPGDMTDQNSLLRVINTAKPDEVYNLAAQSFVGESWNTPEMTTDITGLGCLRMLEALRESKRQIRFYQASSSEMFGTTQECTAAHEDTPFYPRSPYGIAKLYAHWMTVNYRESYDMFAVSGILFNHESERRGPEFVTRKITQGVAKIKLGIKKKIILGNLDTARDWGYAPEYVRAMWLMLQEDSPKDYVIATGVMHTLRDLLTVAFREAEIPGDWQDYIEQDPKYMRPAEVPALCGSSVKAEQDLNWGPRISFETMIRRMVHNDIEMLHENPSNR